MCAAKIIFTVSYLLVALGSAGMIVFARKASLATGGTWELKHSKEEIIFKLTAYQLWFYSWCLILLGTLGQIIATWC